MYCDCALVLCTCTVIQYHSKQSSFKPPTIGVLKHGSQIIHLKRKIKKVRVKVLPSGNLVDMQGNIVRPETLANPKVRALQSTNVSINLSLSLSHLK